MSQEFISEGSAAAAATASDSAEPFVSMKKTTVERESARRQEIAQGYISHLPPEINVRDYFPSQLSNAIFCGHLVTDLDSIAGAIGAAELYGGIPARASEVNSETKFALQLWNVDMPRPIEELLVEHPSAGVCLVDHQQMSQLNKAIELHRIVGVIDHHALQNSTIVTDMPIYIDIRPWGSMSSIIAHTFLTLRRRPKPSTAGMLLSAILSDTLNLQSPTTTDWDRLMVACLLSLSSLSTTPIPYSPSSDVTVMIGDVQQLAHHQFKAKSAELKDLTAEALVTGDQKIFTYKTANFEGSVAFAVIETTDDEVILARRPELLLSLAADRDAKGLSLSFLAVVNIVALHSTLLVCGENELSLARAAFPEGVELTTESDKDTTRMSIADGVEGEEGEKKSRPSVSFFMDEDDEVDIESTHLRGGSPPTVKTVHSVFLGRLVSRKKDFVPAISNAIKKGWGQQAPKGRIRMSKSDVFDLSKVDDD